jgi:peptidoglycan hydrolase CwlO-like protein
MEMMDALRRMLHEAVLPELGAIRAENAEIKSILQLTNKRIDDIQAQLVDQSRRIDETNKRIDETNKRMDQLHSDLLRRMDETNRSIARLYEVIVRRDEYQLILERVGRLERGLEDLRARVAA